MALHKYILHKKTSRACSIAKISSLPEKELEEANAGTAIPSSWYFPRNMANDGAPSHRCYETGLFITTLCQFLSKTRIPKVFVHAKKPSSLFNYVNSNSITAYRHRFHTYTGLWAPMATHSIFIIHSAKIRQILIPKCNSYNGILEPIYQTYFPYVQHAWQ